MQKHSIACPGALLILLMLGFWQPLGAANPMVHQQGTQIVDGNGQPLQLRGVHVSGWLLWQGPVWNLGARSNSEISKAIEKGAGRNGLKAFAHNVSQSFFTEGDVRRIAEYGFNALRISFDGDVFADQNGTIDPAAAGWKLLDAALDWCAAHGVYVVLDMYGAPAAQSDKFTADPADKPSLWESRLGQKRTIELWRAIATRYHDRRIIAGYDLLNEPEPPRGKEQLLVDIYRQLIEAIREVDRYHMVILEGVDSATDLFPFSGPLDANQAYGFHAYNRLWPDKSAEQLEEMSRIAAAHQVPLLNSEFGANTLEWTGRALARFEASPVVQGWSFWPWKRVDRQGAKAEKFRSLVQIIASPQWQRAADAITGPSLLGPSREVMQTGLQRFTEDVRLENTEVDGEMLQLLTGPLGGPPR